MKKHATRPTKAPQLTMIARKPTEKETLFGKFRNTSWASDCLALLADIEKDPIQMEHADACLGAIAELANRHSRNHLTLIVNKL